jgi:hypothetical protein
MAPERRTRSRDAKTCGRSNRSLTSREDISCVAGITGKKSFANLYFEMTRAFNEGTVQPTRTRENTTPTRFEDFPDELARAYETM